MPSITKVCLLLVLPALLLFAGCGEGKGNYKEFPGADLLTPGELGQYAHACILANNWEGFRECCVAQPDTTILVNFSGSVREENDMQARRDKIKENPTVYDRGLYDAFTQVVNQVHSGGSFDVEFISAAESENSYSQSRTERTGEIRVHLKNGTCIVLGEAVFVGNRWVIFAETPVTMGTTEPDHAGQQISGGFSAADMLINAP